MLCGFLSLSRSLKLNGFLIVNGFHSYFAHLPKKKGGPCADEPPRGDTAGYLHYSLPEASPFARRAAYELI